jgi:rare lipoprotein A
MKPRVLTLVVAALLAYGCATTAPRQPEAEPMRGVASWYGEEFAGRTTANGEIFDPSQLTAAHRTLPFGTVLDIRNPKTSQTVRVRVNDRGPYIGNRVIDLSYAAAREIGLVEPGVGEVEIAVVKIGSGEREPPVPFEATIAEAPVVAPVASAGDPPEVAFPLPGQGAQDPVAVERVDVETQTGDVLTRKQVGDDGRSLADVPVGTAEAPTASSYDEQRRNRARSRAAATKEFIVQVGAFSVEANARKLKDRLNDLGHRAFVDREGLYRVRIGPFATRDEALATRIALEERGISAMILAE